MSESSPLDPDDRGFLAFKLPPLPSEAKETLPQYCEICERLNIIAHEFLSSARVDSALHRLAACTYLRLLEALQSSYILLRLGLSQEGAVCLRTAFEALALLRACRVKPDLAFAFLSSDENERLKLANANIVRLQHDPAKQPLVEQLRKAKGEIEKSIEDLQVKKVSTYELAQAGGLSEKYDLMWRLVSIYPHISARALDEYIDENGQIVNGPDYRKSALFLSEVGHLFLHALSDFGRLFSIESPKELVVLASRLRDLVAITVVRRPTPGLERTEPLRPESVVRSVSKAAS